MSDVDVLTWLVLLLINRFGPEQTVLCMKKLKGLRMYNCFCLLHMWKHPKNLILDFYWILLSINWLCAECSLLVFIRLLGHKTHQQYFCPTYNCLYEKLCCHIAPFELSLTFTFSAFSTFVAPAYLITAFVFLIFIFTDGGVTVSNTFYHFYRVCHPVTCRALNRTRNSVCVQSHMETLIKENVFHCGKAKMYIITWLA